MEYLHKVPLHIFLHTVRLNRKGELGGDGGIRDSLREFSLLLVEYFVPKYILHFFLLR